MEIQETFLVDIPVKRGLDEVKPVWDMLNDNGHARGYIAGSFAAWMAVDDSDWQPNDIDIFAASDADFSKLKDEIRINLDYWEEYVGEILARFVPGSGGEIQRDIQLIRPNPRWADIKTDLLQSFDISACRALLCSPHTLLADISVGTTDGKVLIVNDPVKTLTRLLKYHRRGVDFRVNELTKVLRAWSAMDGETRLSLLEMHEASPEEPQHWDYDLYDEDDYFYGE